jgi:ribosomal protein S18 acetylase RimI-like enzyme
MTGRDAIVIHRAGAESITRIEVCWKALHRYHREVGPEVGRFRSADESWRMRRHQYQRWLANPESFLLLAEDGQAPVGYAMVNVLPAESVTWEAGDRLAELETLSVLPAFRGHGIGTRLFERLGRELADVGVVDLAVRVLSTNDRARRFYERRGFVEALSLYRGRLGRV